LTTEPRRRAEVLSNIDPTAFTTTFRFILAFLLLFFLLLRLAL
jgi:hypothetical protein